MRADSEHADAPHRATLLPPRRHRPCRHRAAEQGDELAPFQLTELHPIPSGGRDHAQQDIQLGTGSQRR